MGYDNFNKIPLTNFASPLTNYPDWGENCAVGAKHDRRKYEAKTNNLYTVMLRPL